MSTFSLNNQQQQAVVLDSDKQDAWGSGSGNWQQESLAKGSLDSSGLVKGDLCCAPQQSFQQSPVMAERTVLLNKQQQQQQQQQQSLGQSGVIPLKPIYIEQEAVTFNPQRITFEQPPLTIQPEPITIPQPPIVIHPEPIVIPQAPLVFQPGPVTLPRQALSFQPEQITLNRPSYSVQPFIQFDVRGCAKFDQADCKQHTHIKLTNEQLMRQQGELQPVAVQGGVASGRTTPQSLNKMPANSLEAGCCGNQTGAVNTGVTTSGTTTNCNSLA